MEATPSLPRLRVEVVGAISARTQMRSPIAALVCTFAALFAHAEAAQVPQLNLVSDDVVVSLSMEANDLSCSAGVRAQDFTCPDEVSLCPEVAALRDQLEPLSSVSKVAGSPSICPGSQFAFCPGHETCDFPSSVLRHAESLERLRHPL